MTPSEGAEGCSSGPLTVRWGRTLLQGGFAPAGFARSSPSILLSEPGPERKVLTASPC